MIISILESYLQMAQKNIHGLNALYDHADNPLRYSILGGGLGVGIDEKDQERELQDIITQYRTIKASSPLEKKAKFESEFEISDRRWSSLLERWSEICETCEVALKRRDWY